MEVRGDSWPKSRGVKGSLMRIGRRSLSGHIYFISTATKNREPIFTEERYAEKAIQAFTYEKLLKDNDLISWVLMPDHVHWLLQLGSSSNLSNLVASMKSASARLVRQAGYDETIWSKGFHDHRLKHNNEIPQFTRYILENPVKAGLVTHPNQYPYSFAKIAAAMGRC